MSLSCPFFALPMAVRMAKVMTTSSGDLCKSAFLAEVEDAERDVRAVSLHNLLDSKVDIVVVVVLWEMKRGL